MNTREEATRLLQGPPPPTADPYDDVPHPADTEPETPAITEDRFPRLDWDIAFHTDFTAIDWLPGQFMEKGQQTSLVGAGKSGKSIFILDWVYRAISERSFLGDQRRSPINVLYFDRENGLRDIITRLRSLGATQDDLALFTERFDYRLFPRFSGALDASTAAAAELLAIVDERKPDVVILDTVSRFISGNENDSNTWLDFYRHIHAPLKSRGIACVRLDHTGKDDTRGSRGSSAKSQDVDHVWELTASEGVTWLDHANNTETITTHLKLKRTHTRTGIGDDIYTITRRGIRHRGGDWTPSGTRHELTAYTAGSPDEPAPEGSVEWVVQQLDAAGVPREWGNRLIKTECARLGIKARGEVIQEAVRRRKTDPDLPVGNGARSDRSARIPDVIPERSWDNAGDNVSGGYPQNHENAGQTLSDNVGITPDTPQEPGVYPPLIEGGYTPDTARPRPVRTKDGPHGICSACHERMVILFAGQDRHPLCEDDETPPPEDQ